MIIFWGISNDNSFENNVYTYKKLKMVLVWSVNVTKYTAMYVCFTQHLLCYLVIFQLFMCPLVSVSTHTREKDSQRNRDHMTMWPSNHVTIQPCWPTTVWRVCCCHTSCLPRFHPDSFCCKEDAAPPGCSVHSTHSTMTSNKQRVISDE